MGNIQFNEIHGGNIYGKNITADLSVNINPMGIHPTIMKAVKNSLEHCTAYPDYNCTRLKELMCSITSLNPENIVFGNGASDIFTGIIHAFMPQKAFIFAPSFYGYTRSLESISCKIQYGILKEEDGFKIKKGCTKKIPLDTEILFLCLPNNPTGIVPDKIVVTEILDYCREHNILVVYDQCFLEFTDKEKELDGVQFLNGYPNLIVVNAFTKTFAIPGLRLGYALGNEKLIERIEKHLAEWRISVPALAAGIAAMKIKTETDWLIQSKKIIQKERNKMIKKINEAGIKTFDSEANFILVKTELPLYDIFLRNGILIRKCGNFIGLNNNFYRLAAGIITDFTFIK